MHSGLVRIGRFGHILKHPGLDSGLIGRGEIGKLDVYVRYRGERRCAGTPGLITTRQDRSPDGQWTREIGEREVQADHSLRQQRGGRFHRGADMAQLYDDGAMVSPRPGALYRAESSWNVCARAFRRKD